MEHPAFFLADEMGAGKTLQVIVTAQLLHEADVIDRVVVVCPASVRFVWVDEELGELKKHLFLPAFVTEYHAKLRQWGNKAGLRFVITNYDFIRDECKKSGIVNERLIRLLAHCGPKTLLVLDESSAVKNHSAQQTKACMALRKKCGRVILLNGTPIANNPGDLFSQALMMDPKILDCKSWYVFRARYAKMGGWMQKQITGWVNLEDLQRRLAPYVLRRLKKDCLDLPEKLPSVPLAVPLTEQTWRIYKQMRDEMVAWLTSTTVVTVAQAIVKAIRLAQITSGFVGGVEDEVEDWESTVAPVISIKEVGREKLDFFLAWLEERLAEDPNFKLLVWCRFRPELARVLAALQQRGGLSLGEIRGGQKKDERDAALRLLDPRTAPEGPVVVCGTPSSGSMGLNLTTAHTVIYLSNDFSLKTRLQSEDRVHRPGQVNTVSYYDVIATGPQGQKTVDHVVMKALRDKEQLASWTTAAWVRALQE